MSNFLSIATIRPRNAPWKAPILLAFFQFLRKSSPQIIALTCTLTKFRNQTLNKLSRGVRHFVNLTVPFKLMPCSAIDSRIALAYVFCLARTITTETQSSRFDRLRSLVHSRAREGLGVAYFLCHRKRPVFAERRYVPLFRASPTLIDPSSDRHRLARVVASSGGGSVSPIFVVSVITMRA